MFMEEHIITLFYLAIVLILGIIITAVSNKFKMSNILFLVLAGYFLKFFGLALERDRAYIRALAEIYIDADRAPPPVLDSLGVLLGIDLPSNWCVMRKRAHIKQATTLWKKKGTLEAALMAAYRASGIIPTYKFVYENLLYTNMYDRTTLDTTANNYTMTVGGHWYRNGGTFTVNNSTVTFNGSGEQQLTGSTTFYGFKALTSGSTLQFEAGTTTYITNMVESATKYCSYPDNSNVDEIKNFMKTV